MKQIKSFIFHPFGLSGLQKSVMVSLLLHLAIFMIFFVTQMMKPVADPEIMSITFQNEAELTAGSPPVLPPPTVRPQTIATRNNQQAMPGKAAEAEHHASVRVEEESPVLIAQKDWSENQSTAKESASQTTVAAASAARAEMTPSVLFRSGLASGDGSESPAQATVADARFGDREAPSFVYQEIPVYPSLARRLGKEGRVLLQLLIDADGKLQQVEVVETAGYGFAEASIAAVRKSTYAPGYRDGVKVATRALLPVSFRLQ